MALSMVRRFVAAPSPVPAVVRAPAPKRASSSAAETFATKTEATRHLAQVETDLGRGQWSDPRLGRTTFSAWAARWEATTVNLRANTRAAYRNLLRRYLLPTFGPMRLADLDAMAVRSWLAKLEREGVGASTRAKSYRLLSRILGTAIESGYLARSPCTIRGAAAEPAPEMRFATVAEVAALADAIRPRFRALVLVAAYTGLRWGELAGLRVKRVDLLHRPGSPWPSSSWRSVVGWPSGRPRPAPACAR